MLLKITILIAFINEKNLKHTNKFLYQFLNINYEMTYIILIGFLMILIGILIIMFAIILGLLMKKETEKEHFKGGAVIMIGPIPIVLSTDPKSAKILILLAIVLVFALILLTFFSKIW